VLAFVAIVALAVMGTAVAPVGAAPMKRSGSAFQTMFGALLPPSAGHLEAQRLRIKKGAWCWPR